MTFAETPKRFFKRIHFCTLIDLKIRFLLFVFARHFLFIHSYKLFLGKKLKKKSGSISKNTYIPLSLIVVICIRKLIDDIELVLVSIVISVFGKRETISQNITRNCLNFDNSTKSPPKMTSFSKFFYQTVGKKTCNDVIHDGSCWQSTKFNFINTIPGCTQFVLPLALVTTFKLKLSVQSEYCIFIYIHCTFYLPLLTLHRYRL